MAGSACNVNRHDIVKKGVIISEQKSAITQPERCDEGAQVPQPAVHVLHKSHLEH
jgi:hypothetical protein